MYEVKFLSVDGDSYSIFELCHNTQEAIQTATADLCRYLRRKPFLARKTWHLVAVLMVNPKTKK